MLQSKELAEHCWKTINILTHGGAGEVLIFRRDSFAWKTV